MREHLKYEQQQNVVILTLNDPATRNALNGDALFEEFDRAVDRLNRDLNIRAAILTGAGTSFSSGGNIRDMREKRGMFAGNAPKVAAGYQAGIQRIPKSLWRLDVPLIAAVNGPAIGAGCDLACMCDIRIASDRAVFAASFLKLGIIPGDGGAWFLPRVVGYSRSAEMLFTGESLDAEAAHQIGLVSRVVPHENLMEEAMALALRIARNPPQVLRWTKRVLRESRNAPLNAILDLSATYQALAHETADHREAIAAFFEKREPEFTGQ
jgi:enoyl-CoA hydratase/carnithine racemase